MNLPHPIPYQGSKRLLAPEILSIVKGRTFRRLFEPFAGSAAITIAAAHCGIAKKLVIGEALEPLAEIWKRIISGPEKLASDYERLWAKQRSEDDDYYLKVRETFNSDHDPVKLLYLLARCVKNSPRFNSQGDFNQTHDRRRLGMRPSKMRQQIVGASGLLAGRTEVRTGDFLETIEDADSRDLVYMDPPWEGTTTGRDKRYLCGLERHRIISTLETLNRRHIRYLLSYDGRCGEKTYGEPLPSAIADRLELVAGRSSQATLNGQAAVTIESLYLSPGLAKRQAGSTPSAQISLFAS